MKETLGRLTDEQLKHVYDEYQHWCQNGSLPDDAIMHIIMIQAKKEHDNTTVPMLVAPLLSELAGRQKIAFSDMYDIFMDNNDPDYTAQKMFRVANNWR